MLGIGHDITERKQAETHLQLAASVFAHAREGIIIITDAAGAQDAALADRHESMGASTKRSSAASSCCISPRST